MPNQQVPQSDADSFAQLKEEAAGESIDYWTKKGRLELWSGVETVNRMKAENESHRRNREAEEAHVRKTVWGWEGDSGTYPGESQQGGDSEQQEGEDMASTYLGDITHNHPPAVVYPPQQPAQQPAKQSSGLGTALTAAALTALPVGAAAGVAGYFLGGSGDEQQAENMDVQVGLGKIEDYFGSSQSAQSPPRADYRQPNQQYVPAVPTTSPIK